VVKYTRIRPRYVVVVWQWDRAECCYTAIARFTGYRTLTSAIRRADSEAVAMPAVETTWQLRAYARSGFATVQLQRYKRDDGRTHYRAPGFPLRVLTLHTSLAETHYVPSADEQGWA
jgi:hypothetical protein